MVPMAERAYFSRIFAEDPSLLDGVPEEATESLSRLVTVPVVERDPGPWNPEAGGGDHFGYLIIDGFIVNSVDVVGRTGVALLGPGDTIFEAPWEAASSITQKECWRVVRRARIATLGHELLRSTSRWPQVGAALMQRSSARLQSSTMQIAIGQLRNAHSRVLVFLWHVADRWGRMENGEVTVPVALSHAELARMVSLQRQTTTSALNDLIRAGRVGRRDDGRFVLYGSPPAEASDLVLNGAAQLQHG